MDQTHVKSNHNYQKGDIVHHRNGSYYEVIAIVNQQESILRRVSDDYLLAAVNMKFCDDCRIEWEYSYEIGFPKSIEDAISENLALQKIKFSLINVRMVQLCAIVFLDGYYFGVYDVARGQFILYTLAL